jgi:hypothetical protein
VTHSASNTWQRLLLAFVSLVAAAFLLWPAPAKPRTVTWEDLLFPIVPGGFIARGYSLSPPRRGEERDVIFTARRDDATFGPPARIEVHVVDKGQWPGIRETTSFGVAYETPRSQASLEDLEAITDVVANHLRSNDVGYVSVASIPLAAEPSSPWMTRVLERTHGLRGMLVVVLLAVALGFVASIPQRGDAFAAALLFLLGLGLRLPHLDVPFVHDQDVQRFFTGQYPLGEILTGKGLEDRHPPLWFVVLHFAGLFGQTEAMARLPAVIAGAAIGPAIIGASRWVRTHGGISSALCGLVVTISPVLVMRSREVSEIPFFSVLVIYVIAIATRLSRSPSPRAKPLLALVTALLAWTYYLAPLVLFGIVLSLAVVRRLKKDVLVALGWGVAAGAPAFALGAWTIVRDHGARTVAAQFPSLAWGDRGQVETLAQIWTQTIDSVGVPIILVATLSAIVAFCFRRDAATFVAFGVTVTTAVGITIASRVARIQPYYIIAIIPALPFAVALGPSARSRQTLAWVLVCATSLFLFARVSLPGAGLVYLPDADAFMPKFASFVLQRSERRVVVVAHYDATILAYYVERAAGGSARWPGVEESGEFVLDASKRRVLPLARAHALEEQSADGARAKLLAALDEGPALVIERDAFVLDQIHDELARCDTLLTAPTARLFRCSKRSER